MATRPAAQKASWEDIAARVIDSVLERRLGPGTRIGEADLAGVFHVSRTVVRQALGQLASQGIVTVRPKRGWFVVVPSEAEVADVFAVRRIVETGLVREFIQGVTPAQVRVLRAHLTAQRRAIAAGDVATRSRLLNDFEVAIARQLGNALLTRVVADLTLRTVLVSMLYQTTREASASADDHEQILRAVEARDERAAVRRITQHLQNVEAGLQRRRSTEPVGQLRDTLDYHPAAATERS